MLTVPGHRRWRAVGPHADPPRAQRAVEELQPRSTRYAGKLEQLAQPAHGVLDIEQREIDIDIAQAGTGADHTTIAARAQRAVERRFKAHVLIQARGRIHLTAIDLQEAKRFSAA